jgi:hypothetical protein
LLAIKNMVTSPRQIEPKGWAVSLADAWEANARDWIACARAPGHDGFWDGTWPTLAEIMPAPGGLVLDLGCGEGRAACEALTELAMGQLAELAARVAHGTFAQPCVAALAGYPGWRYGADAWNGRWHRSCFRLLPPRAVATRGTLAPASKWSWGDYGFARNRPLPAG